MEYLKLQNTIHALEKKYDRAANSVSLLAVSKQQPIEKISHFAAQGQKAFGENYVQEALPKIQALQKLNVEWHFIGQIQSNKTAEIAEHFSWVHTVDRLKIAERLHAQRPTMLPPLQICIQININAEKNKGGISLAELPALAKAISALPHLTLRGLMAIPQDTDDFLEQRKNFHALAEAKKDLEKQGFLLDTLSMGMSGDYEAAIAEGATLLRLGAILFGERE